MDELKRTDFGWIRGDFYENLRVKGPAEFVIASLFLEIRAVERFQIEGQ
jgi:hypothetical protein